MEFETEFSARYAGFADRELESRHEAGAASLCLPAAPGRAGRTSWNGYRKDNGIRRHYLYGNARTGSETYRQLASRNRTDLYLSTTSTDFTGQGKWQVGPAAVAGYLSQKSILGVVERMPEAETLRHGLHLAGHASLATQTRQTEVTPWSVVPEEYVDFLIAIYEKWVRRDVGKVFVMNFEWALNAWIGNPSPVCIHAGQWTLGRP